MLIDYHAPGFVKRSRILRIVPFKVGNFPDLEGNVFPE